MFESLKKKLGLLFGKKEEPEAKPKKKTEKKVKQAKQKKEKKKEQVEKEIEVPLKIEQTPIAPILSPDTSLIEERVNELTAQLSAPKPQIQKEPVAQAEGGFFSKLLKRVSASTLTEDDFNSLFSEFELDLLENNVALEAVDSLRESLKKDLVGVDIKKGKELETLKQALKESISSLLQEPPDLLKAINKKLEKPFIIVAVGINGTGKTTTLAKLANYLKENKLSVAFAAADTFRAASIEQLEKHATALKLPLIKKEYNSDPASVAFEAIQYCKKNKIDVLLIDTAGRMHTNSNLMREIEKIVRVSQPDLKLFIGEAITGNDSIEQAKAFDNSIKIDGSILTKAELDEKSGAILSIAHITNKPIFFLGTGQSYKDLAPFTKSWFLKQLGLD